MVTHGICHQIGYLDSDSFHSRVYSLPIHLIHIHTTYILNIIENANTFIYENMYVRKHTPCMRRANLKPGRRKQDTKFTRSSKRLLSFLAVRLDGLLPHRHTRLSTQSCLR